MLRLLAPGVLLLLLVPTALGTHPVDADPAQLARDGGEIIVTIEVAGDYRGSGTGREEMNGGEDYFEATGTARGSYAWAATAFLEPNAKDEGWTHVDRPWANVTMHHRSTSNGGHGQGVGTEYEVHATSERQCTGDGVQAIRPKVLGRIDEAKRAVVLRFEGMGMTDASSLAWTCSGSDTGYDGEVTQHEILPPSALPASPFIAEAIARAAPGYEAREVPHLQIEVPLSTPRQILVGSLSRDYADGSDRRDPGNYYCGGGPYEPTGTCTAQGTVSIMVWINPCKAVQASYDVHLAAVKALAPPPPGSSESQVRAFDVAIRAPIRALLADARSIELACPGDTSDAMVAATEVVGKLAAAWADVEATHKLSRDGVRDALGAERAAQLLGAKDTSANYAEAIARYQGAPGSTRSATMGTHSPVSLHAWDEQGRHVGWSDAKGAPEIDVPGAAYEGRPGDAQTLTLPPGVYRIQAAEIGAGTYTLNLTQGNESELMPLRSARGGSASMLVLVDDAGGLAFAAARGVAQPGFLDAATLRASAAAPPAASPAAGSADAPIPATPLAVALVAVALVARALRRH